MISEHLYALDVIGAGTRVPITSGTCTLDESWVPYVQASLTLPVQAPEVMDLLDPRTKGRVRLTLAQRFGSSEPLSALSADWSGLDLADVSDLYSGQTLASISARYGQPYNTFGTRASTTRRLNLGVRACAVSWTNATVALELASDEALLIDYALVAREPQLPAAPTVRDACAMVLDAIGARLQTGATNGPLEPGSVAWEPGEHAWAYIEPLVQAAGLRLWCDEARRWHLTEPLAPTEGALSLSTATGVTDAEEQISRNTDEWFDAVVIVYTWRDAAGVERRRVDFAAAAGYSRVHTVEIARPWPGDGAAAAMLARTRGRGRIQSASAVSSYTATPGQVLSLTTPGPLTQTGMVSRVTWDMDADLMSVRARDLIELPATSWARIPAGIRWQDIPAGTSWPELDFEEA